MCGMCLPHCPTYQVSRHEAESPRGRISLIKAFAEGSLDASDHLEAHMQSCTGCLTCQHVCPANVDFQTIIDTGKQLYRHKQSRSARILQNLTINVMTQQWGHTVIKLASRFVKYIPNTHRHMQLLRHVTNEPQLRANQTETSITVFPGCTGNLFDQQSLNSLITILNAIGVSAQFPDKLYCCGALSQHSGRLQQAEKDIHNIKHYFKKNTSTTLLSFANGCGRQLDEQFTDSNVTHYDALEWFNTQQAAKELKFSSTNKCVLIHTPCSVAPTKQAITYQLLKNIPGIKLIEFDDNLACCGAGGMQLTSPEESNQRLLDSKVNTINNLKPDVIVSSNIGCSLNFKLGLDKTALDIEVIHPLTLLARQLITHTNE